MMMLTPLQIIFYVFAAIAVGSGIAVVTARHPVRSVLSLVITFFAMAGIWMILRAEFLSLILLLVYVGAVMTLFLFVVMMLSVEKETKRSGFVRFLPIGLIIILLITGLIIVAILSSYTSTIATPLNVDVANYSNLEQIGALLYTEYAYPFEVAGVLLLTAIIAAIALTHRKPLRRKAQNVSAQTAVRREDSIRIVKMPPVKNDIKKEDN